MPKISSARETLARINQRIADEPNPKYKRWIEGWGVPPRSTWCSTSVAHCLASSRRRNVSLM